MVIIREKEKKDGEKDSFYLYLNVMRVFAKHVGLHVDSVITRLAIKE